jgi:hypothetical protein
VIGLSEAVIDCGDGAHDRRCHDSQVSAPPDTVGPVLERSQRVVLRKLRLEDEQAYLTMVAASRSLHHPWTSPPGDQAGFRALMERGAVGDFVSLAGWRADDNTLVAIVNLSQIARGGFQSCYCDFYANAATAGQGLTREALELSLHYAFSREGLTGWKSISNPTTRLPWPWSAESGSGMRGSRVGTSTSMGHGAITSVSPSRPTSGGPSRSDTRGVLGAALAEVVGARSPLTDIHKSV